jgi:hypothetical protein
MVESRKPVPAGIGFRMYRPGIGMYLSIMEAD